MAERKTENLLEQALRKAGFSDDDFHFQGSLEEEVQRCLPSKRSNTEGKGRPEHMIRLNGDAADMLVTECKADKNEHASRPNLTEDGPLKPVKYAEDGVLHYMKGLRREFNVVGLAVSGTGSFDDLRVTTFKCLRGGAISRTTSAKVLKREDYLALLRTLEGYGQKTEAEIATFARDLHDYLRDHMELSEAYKPLIVSGILLGLKDNAFERSYRDISERDDLAAALYEAIKRSLKKAKVKNGKLDAMIANYGFIQTHDAVKEFLRDTISKVYRSLFFALLPNSSFDLLGSFYGEFLRYSGGDKQGLGIVLTPRHITELFSDIADLNPRESVVLDICMGTGGFLIAAMAAMIAKAAGDSDVIERVKIDRLVGIENETHMFTLACANMIFRGDGKANMFFDNCLSLRDPATVKQLAELKPNVALLNPPFGKKAKDKHELGFVKRALDLLQPNGLAIVIVPVNALIDVGSGTSVIKEEILTKHTLRAVMSMPPQLFPNVGTVTATAVFEAHKPHHRLLPEKDGTTRAVPRAETWFGYWRDDGFALKKNKRVERRIGLWDQIRTEWLDAYFNQRVSPGSSCKVAVSHGDEWVAEAYLEPDYSRITQAEYEREVKRYMLFNLMLDAHLELDGSDDEA